MSLSVVVMRGESHFLWRRPCIINITLAFKIFLFYAMIDSAQYGSQILPLP